MGQTTLTVSWRGRRYQVVTNDEVERDVPLFYYCQVYRLRQDGTRGLRIMNAKRVYHILMKAEKDSNK